jgi:trimeric autotransporter adhesin
MHHSHSRTLAIIGLALLSGSGPGWAGPPNPTGSDSNWNTAGGSYALYSNSTGYGNAAFGGVALFNNTGGNFNAAFGSFALVSNTLGSWNTASGVYALDSNTTGGSNTAIGYQALISNTSSDRNTAIGYQALYSNTVGYGENTAIGYQALENNTTGFGNTIVGDFAGACNITGIDNTVVGYAAGSYALGINCGGTDFTNGTALGYEAALTASNSIVLGNTQVTAIYANVTSITALSDRRRKKDIRALDSDLGLDFIEKLQPVSYRFNNGDETERYGFIAQDLEQALPASLHGTIERSQPEHGLALIERQNDKDRTYRVAYGELTAPIVKALQQQQQEIAAEQRENAELRRALAEQAAAFKAETAALRQSLDALRKQVGEQLNAAR